MCEKIKNYLYMCIFCDKLIIAFSKGVTSMKIERISENQIRCTLYKADLADKELLLTELAYGTDKAKELFRELMQQASNELGFEVDNIPLMIEAIPVSKDCLVLIITKVEDPDELDTRFSRFTKPLADKEYYDDTEYDDDMDALNSEESSSTEDANDNQQISSVAGKMAGGLMEALGSLAEGLGLGAINSQKKNSNSPVMNEKAVEVFRLYAFKSLEEVIKASDFIAGIYKSKNSLYKNEKDGLYYLFLTKNDNTDSEFVRVCNVVSEYGERVRTTYATPDYIKEHYKLIVMDDAIHTLAKI